MSSATPTTALQTTIEDVAGFQVAGVHCGLKQNGALDFALFVSDRPCVTAGVFTRNVVKAAPLLVDADHLMRKADRIRAVAINSGCANACTGQQGLDNARATARLVAEKIGCGEDEVLVLSTGVIGPQLDMTAIRRGVDLAVGALGDDWEAAARAIMTTDTRPKLAALPADGYTLAGVVKGAGMLAPNMATMLSVIVTDAALTVPGATDALRYAADRSYNRIVIDGDTSTNDTVLLLANGASGTTLTDTTYQTFRDETLPALATHLAQAVVRDGEGVTKFITITVDGAATDADAHQIANTIANSPLVKTAFYGSDANWGRIAMAAGRAGVSFNPDQLMIALGVGENPAAALGDTGLSLVVNGQPRDYEEARATSMMRAPSIVVRVSVGSGAGQATVWTCDLSHDYVSINADYRT